MYFPIDVTYTQKQLPPRRSTKPILSKRSDMMYESKLANSASASSQGVKRVWHSAAMAPLVPSSRNHPQLSGLVKSGALRVIRKPVGYDEDKRERRFWRGKEKPREPECIYVVGTCHVSSESARDVQAGERVGAGSILAYRNFFSGPNATPLPNVKSLNALGRRRLWWSCVRSARGR